MEKDATQEELEKLHGVLETERSALREVLQAARKAVDDLKVEKQEVEDNLTKEQETTKWQAEEIERLKRLQGGDSSQTTILNQQITTLNQTITELRQTITEHTQTINQLRTENSSLQQQLEDARRNGGNQQASDAENSQLRQTISDLQSQLDQFRNQQKMAQALGGSGGIPCHIATNWTDCDGGNAGTEIDEHCSGANDGKNTIYSVNFECPSNMDEVMAVIKIHEQQVTAAPPVPIKDPKEEVKKLQRLMVLRNPSPPRSRSRGAGDHSASPRGKSPPKKRGTGSISSSPRR